MQETPLDLSAPAAPNRHSSPAFMFLVGFLATLLCLSCGGGSGSGGGGNPGSYTIAVSPNNITVNSASPQTITVSVQALNGFSGTVTGTLGNLPAGVLANPSSFSISGSGSQAIQLSLTTSAQAGTMTITVTSSGGGLSRATQFTLSVAPGSPGIALSAQPGSLTLDPGTQNYVDVQISGTGGYSGAVTGTVTGLPNGVTTNATTFSNSTDNSIRVYFSASATASASGIATIAATSGNYSASVQVSINVVTTADFQLSTQSNNAEVVYQNATTFFTVYSTAYNNFSQPISVSVSGLPSGVTASPSNFSLQPGTSRQVTLTATFSVPAVNAANFSVIGTGGGLTRKIDMQLWVQAPSIALTIQPASITVPAGSVGIFEVEALNTSMNALGTMPITFSAVPTGMTLNPSSLTFRGVGGIQQMLVEATASGAKNGTIQITATYGPYQATGSIGVSVTSGNNFTPIPLTKSDDYVRTESITPYDSFPPPTYLLYHSATNRFFASDGFLDHLYVIDAATHKLVYTINIPGAFGIDQAPDGSVLYVGTMIGDLYVVDPVQLKVIKRYPSTSISDYGFAANAVYALADGKLVLEQYFLVPGYSYVDGNGPLALWDPATNNISVFWQGAYSNPTMPTQPTCLGRFQDVKLISGRTRVLLSPVQTSAGSNFLCSLDPEADTWSWTASTSNGFIGAFTSYAISSDGSTVYAFDGYHIDVFDAVTMATKRSFPVSAGQTLLNYPTMFLSRDEKTIFITDGNSTGIVDAYDVASGTFIGWMPQLNLAANGSYSGNAPIYQAIDQNGIAAGVITSEGVGFIDSAAIDPPPVGTPFMQTQLLLPYGPVGGGTAESWLPSIFGLQTPPPLGSVYFGANAATDLGNNSFEGPMIFAVTPAGTPGPVDVRTFSTDGGSQLLPSGFSYGPWILESPTTYSTAEGGSSATLYGYGFGPPTYTGGATYITPPMDLQVTVGATPATVTAFSPNPYINDVYYSYFTAPPTPKTSLLFTIPPGTPGTTAGITVTNSTGSSTSSGITYLDAVQQFPVNGELVDGIYDPYRDVYYFSDAAQIRVFSLSQKKWLTSILIPVPARAYGPQRLWGLGLSPDSSKLAIADPGAGAIYVVNLSQSTVQSFPVQGSNVLDPVFNAPIAPAVTNQGMVYFATADFNGDGGRGYLFQLNTSTGAFQEVTGATFNEYLPTQGPYTSSRLDITADGSRIYMNDGGLPTFIDTSTSQYVVSASFNNVSYIGQGSYESVLAPSQTRLFLDGFTTDTNLNPIGLQALDTAQVLDAAYVYGAAFSSDGSLLFQPGLYSIDVFDGQTGVFRARIGLPMELAPNYRALVSNKRDSNFVAITGDTGNGIAVIDLNSIPEPLPASYLSRPAAPLAVSAGGFHPRISLSDARKMRNAVTRVPLPERRIGPLARKQNATHNRLLRLP